MSCKIINQTGHDQDALSGVITDFYPYAQEKLGFSGPVAVKLISDKENGADVLGKTAFYNPLEKIISLFTDNRHPKDILRSFSHELVHHAQNERGEFDNLGEIGEGYAQKNEHLREMESEAYLKGNLNFRDFEDGIKAKRKKTMNLNESTLKEMVMDTLKELFEQDFEVNAPITEPVPNINSKIDVDTGIDENEELDEAGLLGDLKLKLDPRLKADMAPPVPNVGLKPTTSVGKAAKLDAIRGRMRKKTNMDPRAARAAKKVTGKSAVPTSKEIEDLFKGTERPTELDRAVAPEKPGGTFRSGTVDENEETPIPDVTKPTPKKKPKKPDVTKPIPKQEPVPFQESVSDEQWYKSTIYETLKKKWTK